MFCYEKKINGLSRQIKTSIAAGSVLAINQK